MIPGEYFLSDGEVIANEGRRTVELSVENTGDRPIQVGSHFHFFEANRALAFDRAQAFGMRLNVPAGTAVRFEPGDAKRVTLVELAVTYPDPLTAPPALRPGEPWWASGAVRRYGPVRDLIVRLPVVSGLKAAGYPSAECPMGVSSIICQQNIDELRKSLNEKTTHIQRLATTGGLVSGPALVGSKIPYDPLKDFATIGLATYVPYALIVIGFPFTPEPFGHNCPTQMVPRLNRIWSPAANVVPLTVARLFHGVACVPLPLDAAEQST